MEKLRKAFAIPKILDVALPTSAVGLVDIDFLNRLENGERPRDLVQPPFEDAKDTQIRELKEEIEVQKIKNADLESRLNLIMVPRGDNDGKLRAELAKWMKNNSKLELDSRVKSKIIEEQATVSSYK